MWPLFRPFPPIAAVDMSVRGIVAAGALIQRELVDSSKFSSLGRERGFESIDNEFLETLDERGFVCPLAFVRGGWSSWHSVEPYPVDGIEFREENGFRPWAEYEHEGDGVR